MDAAAHGQILAVPPATSPKLQKIRALSCDNALIISRRVVSFALRRLLATPADRTREQ